MDLTINQINLKGTNTRVTSVSIRGNTITRIRRMKGHRLANYSLNSGKHHSGDIFLKNYRDAVDPIVAKDGFRNS